MNAICSPEDLRRFAATCRVVGSLRNTRIGAVGARPAAFNTVRFGEKLFERSGISVETLDLSEVLGWIQKMPDGEPAVKAKLDAIGAYTGVKGIPTVSLMKMAKLGVAIDRWTKDQGLSATAIQCWTSLEEFYGVVPCTLMSMMSESLMRSACETDVAGLVGMYVLQAASGQPSALLDWNNNFGDDPNKGVVFHCSNLPNYGPSLESIGHSGLGGSCGFGDPVASISVGYVMNKQPHHLMGDPRSLKLIETLYACL